jgi:UDP-glucuronate 4-epimerase
MKRDFTYIDDIVEGVVRVMSNPPQNDPEWSRKRPDPSTSLSPYKLYNIGNNAPVELLEFIRAIEKNSEKLRRNSFYRCSPGMSLLLGQIHLTCSGIQGMFHPLRLMKVFPVLSIGM